MKMKHAVIIIAAFIEAVGVIAAAIIGAAWGKNNIEIIAPISGESIVINNAEVQNMATENEDFKIKLSECEQSIESLQRENDDLQKEKSELTSKLGVANGALDEVPSIEFQNLGLSIDGEEKNINQDKSSVYINGKQYYSKEFVDNLLPNDKVATVKDGMFYVGKIIRDKTNLVNMVAITSKDCEKWDSIIDTYGNTYSNALYFKHSGSNVIYNAERGFSNLKCIVAMKQGSNGNGYLQIETDDENVVYTSPQILNLTEPFEIDVPINQTSKIVIKCINGTNWCEIIVSNAVLYNQQ